MCVKETHVRATAFTYMGFVFRMPYRILCNGTLL